MKFSRLIISCLLILLPLDSFAKDIGKSSALLKLKAKLKAAQEAKLKTVQEAKQTQAVILKQGVQKHNQTKIKKGMSLDNAIALLGEPTDRLVTSTGSGLLHFISYDDKVFIEYDSKSKVIVNWFGSYKHSVLKKFFTSDSSAKFTDPLYRTQPILATEEPSQTHKEQKKLEYFDIMSKYGVSKRAAKSIIYNLRSQNLTGEAANKYVKVFLMLHLRENGSLP